MAASDNHDALLNQLQAQVNQVLEQTGRIFAAMNTNPKDRPIAQIAKLQNVLPAADRRFHDALDQLETELQRTMLVMRRDLAVAREGSGLSTQAPVLSQPMQDTAMQNVDDPPSEQHDAKATEIRTSQLEHQPAGDVMMEDAKPSLPAEDLPEVKPVKQASSPHPEDSKPHVPEATGSQSASEDTKPAILHLQTDTQAASQEDQDAKPKEDEKAPDTAAETNNDLDSLFNDDNLSAGGLANDSGEFSFEHNDGGIDFGDFGQIDANNAGDNDNIASLLPGLEDYANTQSNEVDLDQLFNLNSTDDAGGMDAQGAGEQGDSFEDLLAGFENGEAVDNNQNSAAGQDFDFDSLFS